MRLRAFNVNTERLREYLSLRPQISLTMSNNETTSHVLTNFQMPTESWRGLSIHFMQSHLAIFPAEMGDVSRRHGTQLNLLKPTVHVMHQQFNLTSNNCTLCPHRIYVFCIYLRTNSDLCHLQHKLIGFYNRDEKCLQRGTDWVFK
jgi:hypothetical protein